MPRMLTHHAPPTQEATGRAYLAPSRSHWATHSAKWVPRNSYAVVKKKRGKRLLPPPYILR